MNDQHFEEMYRNHYKVLRNAARQLTGDDDASHDLVQEVFVKLWNKKESFDTILNPGAYLYRSVVNASLTYLSQNKKHRTTDDLSLASDSQSGEAIETRELEARIRRALERLPPKCRAIFVLSRFEEKKNKEIAAIMGLSLKTVENQMGIALKKMRGELKPYLSDDLLTIAGLWFAVNRVAPPGMDESSWVPWTPFSYPFNLTQQPAASIPWISRVIRGAISDSSPRNCRARSRRSAPRVLRMPTSRARRTPWAVARLT